MGKFINADNLQYVFNVFMEQAKNEFSVITNIESETEENVIAMVNDLLS